MIQCLAVVGVGLLGGSVAKAARAHGLAREIVGIGRAERRLGPALADGTLDRATVSLAEGVAGADMVVLATPVGAIERLLAQVWDAVPSDALLTDVGSTKTAIVRAGEGLAARRPIAFVGSHPMAGSEQSGYALARADLFRDATVIVTPTDASEPRAVKAVSAFWEGLGAARIVTLDPQAHDRAVAAISHLPHLVACALVDGVARFDAAALEVAARGFRDTTRIAAGDPEVWEEIFLANQAALAGATREFLRALAELTKAIESGNRTEVRAALARIKAQREALP
ncbi:MAG: prephenate dehydrogenase/arogenate dehydrogenase family protein [Candidatus Rokubacteria bacterium]|nr:prephenate dehydrogenase/arogenate dehydrogenase family protein [Candidatus Rokubacteria bacterium]